VIFHLREFSDKDLCTAYFNQFIRPKLLMGKISELEQIATTRQRPCQAVSEIKPSITKVMVDIHCGKIEKLKSMRQSKACIKHSYINVKYRVESRKCKKSMRQIIGCFEHTYVNSC